MARFRALILFKREAAETSQAAKASRVLEMARTLELSPQPYGNGPNNWGARCPRGSSHSILIVASADVWGCPYCRRKGNAADLKIFSDEIKVVYDAAVTARMLPSPALAAKPKRIKVPNKVTVTVEWGNGDHSITISARNWQRVVNGHATEIRGKGYQQDGAFTIGSSVAGSLAR